mmetsp:Transcript_5664/g.5373  ORF Transcript_5664/g.5373 Transcript_5664/m.5373 type:complete len:125 (+) Transcript_5664:230-604(+)
MKKRNHGTKKALILIVNKNSRVLSSAEGNPAMQRRSSLDQQKIYKQFTLKPKKKLKRTNTAMSEVAKKLKDVEVVQKRKQKKKMKIPWSNITANDIHIFIFLVILLIFGVILSIAEFMDYSSSF